MSISAYRLTHHSIGLGRDEANVLANHFEYESVAGDSGYIYLREDWQERLAAAKECQGMCLYFSDEHGPGEGRARHDEAVESLTKELPKLWAAAKKDGQDWLDLEILW